MPVGIDAAVVVTDLGFGYGERVTVVASHALRVTGERIPIRIAVYVPATDASLPVQVEVVDRVVDLLGPTTVTGTANQWIVLTTSI